MLEISIENTEQIAASCLDAFHHGRGQATLTFTVEQPDARVLFGISCNYTICSIGTVVDENNLERHISKSRSYTTP